MISPVSTQPAAPEPERASATGRSGHGFYEVFSGVHEHRAAPESSVGSAAFAPGAETRALPPEAPPPLSTGTPRPPVEISRQAVATPHNETPAATPVSGQSAGVSTSDLNTAWLSPSQPVSLEPLFEAMRREGLDPAAFRYEQLEAFVPFPTRPELSYTTRQLVIHGAAKSDMFDRDLVLKTPWVTVTELKTLGIA